MGVGATAFRLRWISMVLAWVKATSRKSAAAAATTTTTVAVAVSIAIKVKATTNKLLKNA